MAREPDSRALSAAVFSGAVLAILAVLAAAVLLLSGCRSLSAQEEQPAVIAKATPESRAELARVVTEALNGAPVTLADDALTRDSLLVIERKPPRSLRQEPATGRMLGSPEQFRLVMDGSECVLVRQRDGKRWTLTHTACAAAEER